MISCFMSATDISNKMNTGEIYSPWRSPWFWVIPALAALAMSLLWATGTNKAFFLAINGLGVGSSAALWANITTFGDTLVVFSMTLFLVRRNPRLLWVLFLAAILGTVVVHGLKEWMLVKRPPAILPAEQINVIGTPHKAVSFPSGHTTAAFTLVALLCLLQIRLYWKAALVAAAALVGVSRIVVGVHWPMDVLGGVLIGWSSVLAAAVLAPRIRWGESVAAQRLFAGLCALAALLLIFAHDSGYAQARVLEIAIGVTALLLNMPNLKRLFKPTKQDGADEPERSNEYEQPADPEPKKMLGLAVRILVTVMVFALIFRAIDLQGVMETFKNLVPRLLLLGLAFQVFSIMLASYRWYLVMQPLQFGQNFTFYLRSYFKGMFFNQGLPTSIGGDAVRVIDVARLGYRKREAFHGVAIDRILGLMGLLLLNLVANAFNPDLLPPGIFTIINSLVAAGALGFLVLLGLHRLEWLQKWRLSRFLQTLSAKLAQVLASPRQVLIQLVLSVGIHVLSLVAIFLIGRSVELNYDLATFFVIIPPVILLTLIPVSLAGWGVREGAMIGLFTLIGADETTVLSMSILYGLVLIIASLPGFYVYVTGKHRI